MDQQRSHNDDTHVQRHGFVAGIIAALVMTAAMAVLRYTTGTPSLPEQVGEAIIGLMPAAVFSAILDVMQKAAKPTLYVGIFWGCWWSAACSGGASPTAIWPGAARCDSPPSSGRRSDW